jgi:hypothetical protein
MPVILVTQEAEIRRIVVQSQPRQIVSGTLCQKNPTQKRRVDRMIQVVEHLLSKCEAMSSSPRTTEKEREEGEKGRKKCHWEKRRKARFVFLLHVI